jgi:hypothetical protein
MGNADEGNGGLEHAFALASSRVGAVPGVMTSGVAMELPGRASHPFMDSELGFQLVRECRNGSLARARPRPLQVACHIASELNGRGHLSGSAVLTMGPPQSARRLAWFLDPCCVATFAVRRMCCLVAPCRASRGPVRATRQVEPGAVMRSDSPRRRGPWPLPPDRLVARQTGRRVGPSPGSGGMEDFRRPPSTV